MTAAIGAGLGIGAGVGISSVALAPFNAANTFLGSAFFGYGMILGERYMYQADWPKIQQRLVNGEKIENIIQEYTGVFTAVVMKEAKIIFDTVTQEFIKIMREAVASTNTSTFRVTTGADEEAAARRGRTNTPPELSPRGDEKITGGKLTGASIKQFSESRKGIPQSQTITNATIDKMIVAARKITVKPKPSQREINQRNEFIRIINVTSIKIKNMNRSSATYKRLFKSIQVNQKLLSAILVTYDWN